MQDQIRHLVLHYYQRCKQSHLDLVVDAREKTQERALLHGL